MRVWRPRNHLGQRCLPVLHIRFDCVVIAFAATSAAILNKCDLICFRVVRRWRYSFFFFPRFPFCQPFILAAAVCGTSCFWLKLPVCEYSIYLLLLMSINTNNLWIVSCSSGVLLQVYLGRDGTVEVYENTTVHPNSPINSDLLLDLNGAHIYIMTKTRVSLHTFGKLWVVIFWKVNE